MLSPFSPVQGPAQRACVEALKSAAEVLSGLKYAVAPCYAKHFSGRAVQRERVLDILTDMQDSVGRIYGEGYARLCAAYNVVACGLFDAEVYLSVTRCAIEMLEHEVDWLWRQFRDADMAYDITQPVLGACSALKGLLAGLKEY